MEAIVLAGGLGTRLRSAVADLPKVLAPVAGRPFLSYVLEHLAAGGFRRILLSIGYLGNRVREEFGTRQFEMELIYVHEDHPLGTGGAILRAMQEARDERLFVVNGDTYLHLDYGAMAKFHTDHGARLTIAARRVADASRFGTLEVVGGRVVAFREKEASRTTGVVNAGVYVIEKDIFDSFALPSAFSFESELLAAQCDRLRPFCFETDASFIDIGIPEDYRRAQGLLQSEHRERN